MRIVLTACTSLAITLAAVAVNPSLAVAADAGVSQEASPLRSQLDQIRVEVAKGNMPCDELVAQIDALVAQIDALLDAGTDNQIELIKIRNGALSARVRVQCDADHFHNGQCIKCGRSTNGTTLTNDAPADQPIVGGTAVNGDLPAPLMTDPMMGPMMGDPMMGGMGQTGGGGFSTAGGGAAGGSGAAGSGGGGMGFIALGGIAAAIAIPLSVDDDDAPGPIASPIAP